MMNVKYKTVYEEGREQEYVVWSVSFCCVTMQEAYNKSYVKFGEFDVPPNQSKTVNIFYCTPYPCEAMWDLLPIKLCPWCGVKIETEEINE